MHLHDLRFPLSNPSSGQVIVLKDRLPPAMQALGREQSESRDWSLPFWRKDTYMSYMRIFAVQVVAQYGQLKDVGLDSMPG